MRFTQLLAAAKQLSPAEKLKMNAAILNDDVTIPIEHQQEELRRMDMAKANPDLLLDFDIAFQD